MGGYPDTAYWVNDYIGTADWNNYNCTTQWINGTPYVVVPAGAPGSPGTKCFAIWSGLSFGRYYEFHYPNSGPNGCTTGVQCLCNP